MDAIIQKLGITKEEYETTIFELYFKWSEGVSTNKSEHQKVLANSSINSWFIVELGKCEVEFLKLTRHYTNPNVTIKDFNRCYNECLYKLFSIRPNALLKHIIKPKIQGIPVFNALFIN